MQVPSRVTSATWSQIKLGRVVKGRGEGAAQFSPHQGRVRWSRELREVRESASQPCVFKSNKQWGQGEREGE